jgi:predicted DNA-binding protein
LVNVNDELKEVTDTDTDELKEVIDDETDELKEIIDDDTDELKEIIDDDTDELNDVTLAVLALNEVTTDELKVDKFVLCVINV